MKRKNGAKTGQLGPKKDGYRLLVDQVAYMHLTSAIFNRQTDWVIHHELSWTIKIYRPKLTLNDWSSSSDSVTRPN